MKTILLILLCAAPVAYAAEKGVAYPKQAAFANAKKAVAYVLKDGDSAKFRELKTSRSYESIVCGEVNAKNSMGAYSGFQRFISSGTPTTTMLEESEPNFAQSWVNLCLKTKEEINSAPH